ncbi:hypothetical protein [Flavobacterium johnsoniae]|uniref:XRE family transcriptional regulator n=1 Tax=Flavobacterium johnsoniae (strain ATCC 17061 / DSM 2064 / JCM 8514 / BCRC 14874 / CCUG 350202 / NBRC 14942 / NCIMB 11054 / UW101) TaxID=376686 RepID=A5FE05_FLAJ1|nr:hypothetical protein [Flavobacterium johnsoniae]ABQ06569.1 hypothetical protein Fjoh_3555 [Flavobacterium johnsoniae UW101]WQG82320.1 hypothetical protein SR927_04210 [Flavobacterium johnsoniae UW101]SHK79810.1 hypothetical protein SAMN05444146_2306 [Flavobacterium johnsoniae]
MALKNENSKPVMKPQKTKVFLVDQHVCNFIKEEWMKDIDSFRDWARQHNVHESIARKINQIEGYKIPVSTLKIICFYRQITLADFFKLVENKYGDAEDKFYYIEKKKDV